LVHFLNLPPLFHPIKLQKSTFFTGHWKLVAENCFGPHPQYFAKNQGAPKIHLQIGPIFPKNGPIWTVWRTFGPFLKKTKKLNAHVREKNRFQGYGVGITGLITNLQKVSELDLAVSV